MFLNMITHPNEGDQKSNASYRNSHELHSLPRVVYGEFTRIILLNNYFLVTPRDKILQ